MDQPKDASPQSRLAAELSRLRNRTIDGAYPEGSEGDPPDLGFLFEVIRSLYPGTGSDQSDMIASIKLGITAAAAALPPGKYPNLGRESTVTRQEAALILYGLYSFSDADRTKIANYEWPPQEYAKWARYLREKCGLPKGSSIFKRFRSYINSAIAHKLLQAERAGGFDQLRVKDTDLADDYSANDRPSVDTQPETPNLPALLDTPPTYDTDSPSGQPNGDSRGEEEQHRQDSQADSNSEPPPFNPFDRGVVQYVAPHDGGHAYAPIGGHVHIHNYAPGQQPQRPRTPGSTEPEREQ